MKPPQSRRTVCNNLHNQKANSGKQGVKKQPTAQALEAVVHRNYAATREKQLLGAKSAKHKQKNLHRIIRI